MINDNLVTEIQSLSKNFISNRNNPLSRNFFYEGNSFSHTKLLQTQQELGLPHYGNGIVDRSTSDRWIINHVKPSLIESSVHANRPAHYAFKSGSKWRQGFKVYSIEDAFFSYDINNAGQPEIYVFDSAGKLIDGLSFGINPFIEESPLEINDSVFMLDDFFVKFNICHLLFDKLPRLQYMQPNRCNGENVFLFAHNPYTNFLAKTLGVTEVSSHLNLKKRTSIKIKRLIISSNSFYDLAHPGLFGSPNTASFINERVLSELPSPSKQHRKIYITRKNEPYRRALNEEDVCKLVKKFGYTSINPTDMTPKDQLSYFRDASSIVGVHGAGLSNLAFIRPHGSVIELLPPLCATPAYWYMSNCLNKNYFSSIGEDSEIKNIDQETLSHNSSFNRRDILVNLKQLGDILKR